METFTPEFAAFWLSDHEPSGERHAESHASQPNLSPSQQVALEELAERVTAARSVV
jgi:hypothetical protein